MVPSATLHIPLPAAVGVLPARPSDLRTLFAGGATEFFFRSVWANAETVAIASSRDKIVTFVMYIYNKVCIAWRKIMIFFAQVV